MESSDLRLYRSMLRIRRIEEAIATKYSLMKMRCPVHLSIGQEAVAVGVSSVLKKNDYAISAHRSHAHYLAKGGNLNEMLAELHGKKTGCARGKGGSMHLFDMNVRQIASVPIVGSSIPIATGIAWQIKLKKQDELVVVYFGDGATEEGVFSECLTFASLHNLPILFVCENNLYSVYSPISNRQDDQRNIVAIAESHGVRAVVGDGNDVKEVINLAKWGTQKILKSGKPALIEYKTFRFVEHCGPEDDDFLGYRGEGELNRWLKNCPLVTFKNILLTKKLMSEQDEKEMIEAIDSEIKLGFSFADSSDYPSPEQLFTEVYSEVNY